MKVFTKRTKNSIYLKVKLQLVKCGEFQVLKMNRLRIMVTREVITSNLIRIMTVITIKLFQTKLLQVQPQVMEVAKTKRVQIIIRSKNLKMWTMTVI